MYYYPCIDEDKANTYLYGAPFYVIEVTEKEWEALFELDRFEYNNWHKYYRHNEPFPKDEEVLPEAERMRYSDRDKPFVTSSLDKLDRNRALATFTKKERQIYRLSIDEQGVYVRLCMEIRRREKNNMHESDKAFSSIYTAVEKIAKPAKLSVKDYITQRIYPLFAHRRNDRIRAFYKQYTGKKLPI